MSCFLDLPGEVRDQIYAYFLQEPVQPRYHGVMIISERYVKFHLPLRPYWALLRTCRQMERDLWESIRHLTAKNEMNYLLNLTFSHGWPYFGLNWVEFPALSPLVNSITVNVDLRLREPFREAHVETIPHEHELTHLLGQEPGNIVEQLFDYLAMLLKTLARLMLNRNTGSGQLYTELITLNFRTPTVLVSPNSMSLVLRVQQRAPVAKEEAKEFDRMVRGTLKATVRKFGAFDARNCGTLFPLIQIGSLRFATEGQVWGQGNNMVLAEDDFQWLHY
ncbi:hypothetical protein P154DRAFT_283241 [Amniculicola lignicola CBS 123094]|uniref:F-box domain-containing protein n=1 Tax=Amniculicola lignicola CBS 123094 TaxID=1392246 RepID=A0A6A5W7P4_9PLEO|nr:hypothetical protein P154DRAFT_283241 [Amniculicola lignicola CBS 123094]